MKRFLIIAWLTVLCFLLLGNVHAQNYSGKADPANGCKEWVIPSWWRFNSGARMWFSNIQGDLIQPDRTKLDFSDHLGLKQERLTWEIFASVRYDTIHVFRFRAEPFTSYESKNDSSQVIRDYRLGYDLDFFMLEQVLFGGNIELDILGLETRVNNVTSGAETFNYHDSRTRAIPLLGLHGAFYPKLDDKIALRPNVSSRVGWWNYEGLEAWDWEVAAAVDIPVNRLWTWTISGGYRFWHTKMKRDVDTVDMNLKGFFLETSVLF